MSTMHTCPLTCMVTCLTSLTHTCLTCPTSQLLRPSPPLLSSIKSQKVVIIRVTGWPRLFNIRVTMFKVTMTPPDPLYHLLDTAKIFHHSSSWSQHLTPINNNILRSHKNNCMDSCHLLFPFPAAARVMMLAVTTLTLTDN